MVWLGMTGCVGSIWLAADRILIRSRSFGVLAFDARLKVVDLALQQIQSFVQHVDLAASGQIEAVQEVRYLSYRAADRLNEFAIFPVLFDLLLDAFRMDGWRGKFGYHHTEGFV